MSRMPGAVVLRRNLFLMIGVFTLGLFFVVAVLDRTGHGMAAAAIAPVMRVLIVPIYLVWLLLTLLQVALFGAHGLPQPFGAILWCFDMAAGLAPYALVDYLLALRRRRIHGRRHPNAPAHPY